MSEGREGPHVSYDCVGCRFHEQERFQVQGDSGYDHFCTHGGGRKFASIYSGRTPIWCPFFPTPPEKD